MKIKRLSFSLVNNDLLFKKITLFGANVLLTQKPRFLPNGSFYPYFELAYQNVVTVPNDAFGGTQVTADVYMVSKNIDGAIINTSGISFRVYKYAYNSPLPDSRILTATQTITTAGTSSTLVSLNTVIQDITLSAPPSYFYPLPDEIVSYYYLAHEVDEIYQKPVPLNDVTAEFLVKYATYTPIAVTKIKLTCTNNSQFIQKYTYINANATGKISQRILPVKSKISPKDPQSIVELNENDLGNMVLDGNNYIDIEFLQGNTVLDVEIQYVEFEDSARKIITDDWAVKTLKEHIKASGDEIDTDNFAPNALPDNSPKPQETLKKYLKPLILLLFLLLLLRVLA